MSDPLEIPVALDTALYTIRVTLDGREFILRFDWNGREGRWYLDIGTVAGTWLLRGLKLVCNWPLLRKSVDDRLPPGNLIAIDYSDSGGEPPDYYALGRSVKLLYYPIG